MLEREGGEETRETRETRETTDSGRRVAGWGRNYDPNQPGRHRFDRGITERKGSAAADHARRLVSEIFENPPFPVIVYCDRGFGSDEKRAPPRRVANGILKDERSGTWVPTVNIRLYDASWSHEAACTSRTPIQAPVI